MRLLRSIVRFRQCLCDDELGEIYLILKQVGNGRLDISVSIAYISHIDSIGIELSRTLVLPRRLGPSTAYLGMFR
jgi:hypothetical protein